jgi:hypothetical protein
MEDEDIKSMVENFDNGEVAKKSRPTEAQGFVDSIHAVVAFTSMMESAFD